MEIIPQKPSPKQLLHFASDVHTTYLGHLEPSPKILGYECMQQWSVFLKKSFFYHNQNGKIFTEICIAHNENIDESTEQQQRCLKALISPTQHSVEDI